MKDWLWSGTHGEIGAAHGEALREEIQACLTIYRSMWGLGEEAIERRAASFKAAVSARFPHLAEEIAGIARGSGVSEHLTSRLWRRPLGGCWACR